MVGFTAKQPSDTSTKPRAPIFKIGPLEYAGLLAPAVYSAPYEWGYVQHSRATDKPLLQQSGDKLRKGSVGLVFHYAYCDPENELAKLVQLGNGKEAHEVLLGAEPWGYYVIEKVTPAYELLSPQGAKLQVRVTVDLLEWVGERQGQDTPAPRAIFRRKRRAPR